MSKCPAFRLKFRNFASPRLADGFCNLHSSIFSVNDLHSCRQLGQLKTTLVL